MFQATLAQSIGRGGWRLAAAFVCADEQPLSASGNSRLESRAGNDMAADDLYEPLQCRTSQEWACFGGCYKALIVDFEKPGHFVTPLNYVNLNPARAGLAGMPGAPGLAEYRRSSLLGNVFANRRPDWLRVEFGFSHLGSRDTSRGRKELPQELEHRAREESGGESADELTRSPSLCAESRMVFWKRSLSGLAAFPKARTFLERHRGSGQNYHGPEMSDHGLTRARQILEASLREAGIQTTALESCPRVSCLRWKSPHPFASNR